MLREIFPNIIRSLSSKATKKFKCFQLCKLRTDIRTNGETDNSNDICSRFANHYHKILS